MNTDDLVSEFVAVANVDNAVARAYLTNASWDLDEALSAYYAARDPENQMEPTASGTGTSGPPGGSQASAGSSSGAPRLSSGFDRVRTMDSIRRASPSSEESGEEEGQAFYAGGSEHSGQQVLGPPRARRDLIGDIMRRAIPRRPEEVESRGQWRIFSGTGYTLGDGSSDSRVIRENSGENVDVIPLHFWRNGFTVGDNGQLRSYQDPQNQEFLTRIMMGQIPAELGSHSREMEVNVIDHRTETYVAPRVRVFGGAGQVLGSEPSAPAGAGARAETEPKIPTSEDPASSVEVDESRPVTNIQIRLNDGTRLLGRFNMEHTVGDIRRFIMNSSTAYSNRRFSIFVGFPRKELTEDSTTISDANLQNASLLVHLN